MPTSAIPTRHYLILGRDAAATAERRAAARPAHLARLEALRAEGRLVLAGPLPARDGVPPAEGGAQGSLIVAAFEDLAAARAWAEADPYVAAGVYAAVEVLPFVPVLP